MSTRLELQSKLEELLGSRNVYYQPPDSVQMNYDAIRYSKSAISQVKANDGNYLLHDRYEIIVISKKPDNPVIEAILNAFSYCSYEQHYIADNLYHDVLTLYY